MIFAIAETLFWDLRRPTAPSRRHLDPGGRPRRRPIRRRGPGVDPASTRGLFRVGPLADVRRPIRREPTAWGRSIGASGDVAARPGRRRRAESRRPGIRSAILMPGWSAATKGELDEQKQKRLVHLLPNPSDSLTYEDRVVILAKDASDGRRHPCHSVHPERRCPSIHWQWLNSVALSLTRQPATVRPPPSSWCRVDGADARSGNS
jgi:hypothetical protein